jgi:hypothetical protein
MPGTRDATARLPPCPVQAPGSRRARWTGCYPLGHNILAHVLAITDEAMMRLRVSESDYSSIVPLTTQLRESGGHPAHVPRLGRTCAQPERGTTRGAGWLARGGVDTVRSPLVCAGYSCTGCTMRGCVRAMDAPRAPARARAAAPPPRARADTAEIALEAFQASKQCEHVGRM